MKTAFNLLFKYPEFGNPYRLLLASIIASAPLLAKKIYLSSSSALSGGGKTLIL